MASVKCPACGERVNVREDGKRLRCPECGKSFRPPEDDEDEYDEEDEAPRRRPRRKPAAGSSGTKIAAIIVGGALLVALVAVVVIVLVRKGGPGGGASGDAAKVTLENFNRVKPGVELAEAESILGGSRSSSEDDMRDAFRRAFGEIEAAWETGWARFGEGTVWRRWEGPSYRVWVAFAKTKDGQGAAFSTSIEQGPGGYKRFDGFVTFAGNTDLDKQSADRKKEGAVRDDKKWVRGAQARDLLIGEWRDSLINGYVFAPGGKLTEFSALSMPGARPPTYQIVDDRYLEIVTPSVFEPQPGQPAPPNWVNTKPTARRYEYFVTQDELALVDASPQPIYGLRSYYRFPATAGSAADTKLVAPLIADLRGRDATKRQVAILKVKQLGRGAPTAVPALIELLGGPDTTLSNQAADTLGAMQDAAAPAVPALIEQLRDPNSKRALAVVLALGRLGPAARDALPALREIAKKSATWQTRNEAEAVIRLIEGGKP